MSCRGKKSRFPPYPESIEKHPEAGQLFGAFFLEETASDFTISCNSIHSAP
ncbi:hypothetical protein HMPREF3038_02442 [Akkermansia sp. KLE1797]|nr:hypothetical protein HMPREF3038_02442 [Akkermansia sp. KLE1797]